MREQSLWRKTGRLSRACCCGVGGVALAPGALVALAACGCQAGEGASGAAPQEKRPVTLTIDNDWTQGDRLTVVKAWLERANKVHPHIKTELRENADTQEKTIALFCPFFAEQQGDPGSPRPAHGAGVCS